MLLNKRSVCPVSGTAGIARTSAILSPARVGLYKTLENFNHNKGFKMKFLRKLCTLTIKLGPKLHSDKLRLSRDSMFSREKLTVRNFVLHLRHIVSRSTLLIVALSVESSSEICWRSISNAFSSHLLDRLAVLYERWFMS